jgi:hypothetical protein
MFNVLFLLSIYFFSWSLQTFQYVIVSILKKALPEPSGLFNLHWLLVLSWCTDAIWDVSLPLLRIPFASFELDLCFLDSVASFLFSHVGEAVFLVASLCKGACKVNFCDFPCLKYLSFTLVFDSLGREFLVGNNLSLKM